MVTLGIVANGDKETALETVAILKTIPGLKLIFVRQSDEKLFIVTDRVFNICNKDGDNDF